MIKPSSTLSFALALSLIVISPVGSLHADSFTPMGQATIAEAADAVCVAELVISSAQRVNGQIQTKFTFRLIESLRGDFPPFFHVTSPGGILGYEANADSRLPGLAAKENYLLSLVIENERLEFFNGVAGARDLGSVDLDSFRAHCATLHANAELSPYEAEPIAVDFASFGLFENSGIPRRFTLPDSGLGIPVYADISTLPSGISANEAVTALENALSAWEAASSVKFDYKGTTTFSQSAESFLISDGYVIRIQMHDNFNSISDASNTLGFGGGRFFIDPGAGGTVGGVAYDPLACGYIVLNHPKTSLSNEVTLEEVLTHELGHVIGMAHSSESNPENDSTLSEAIMYYLAHADGRGATLNSHDRTTILQSHPANTPPVAYDRILYAISSPSGTLTYPQVNQVTLTGFDLQGDALTVQQDGTTTNNGSFSLNGNVLTYTPSGFFADGNVSNLETGFFDRFEARISDGTNLSPPIDVRVVGLRSDTQPSGSPDGIPDSWVTSYYGSSNGTTADSDTDGDGLDAKTEFLLGTDPTDPNSGFSITALNDSGELSWSSQLYGVYEVERSSNLTSWTTERFVTETTSSGTMMVEDLPIPAAGEALFYRVNRID